MTRLLPLVGPLLVTATGLALAQARAIPADVGAGGVVPPPTLIAASTVPTQIVLNWPAVAGAEGYRVTRTSDAGEPVSTVYEGKTAAFALDPGMCRGTLPCWYPNNSVSLNHTYYYRVHSIFPGPVYSAPGPVASATSARYLAPANLSHAVVPSTLKPGHLQVTVSWLPVTGAEAYYVVPKAPTSGATTVRTASIRLDPLRPGTTHGLCVSTIYPLGIRDDTVRSCITLVL